MQLFRFAIVGALVALVYVLAYVALLSLGMNQPLANAIAFLAAIALQYVGQASFTFGKRPNGPFLLHDRFGLLNRGVGHRNNRADA
jgi:putative flippase GtrA|tara:strand:- start:194 stop:451 length:258 start_codon:yes stop_codon:yes gene_type:complete